MYGSREAVNIGGLMAHEADQAETNQRVAYYVDEF
jgi:hypothetical protein